MKNRKRRSNLTCGILLILMLLLSSACGDSDPLTDDSSQPGDGKSDENGGTTCPSVVLDAIQVCVKEVHAERNNAPNFSTLISGCVETERALTYHASFCETEDSDTCSEQFDAFEADVIPGCIASAETVFHLEKPISIRFDGIDISGAKLDGCDNCRVDVFSIVHDKDASEEDVVLSAITKTDWGVGLAFQDTDLTDRSSTVLHIRDVLTAELDGNQNELEFSVDEHLEISETMLRGPIQSTTYLKGVNASDESLYVWISSIPSQRAAVIYQITDVGN